MKIEGDNKIFEQKNPTFQESDKTKKKLKKNIAVTHIFNLYIF